MASTWLNQHRWLDETETVVQSETQSTPLLVQLYEHPDGLKEQLIEAFGMGEYSSWFSQCKITKSGCDIEVIAPNGFVQESVERISANSRVLKFFNRITVLVMEAACKPG